MKENLDIFSSNLINKDINNNIVFDSNIKKLQQNLFLMGFDIIQINKIITYFNITSESEALDYLIKGEDGMWNHPFVPKEKVILDDDNSRDYKPNKEIEMKVSKTKFYMMLEMCRCYWKKGGTEWLGLIITQAQEIEKESGVDWVICANLAHAMAKMQVSDENCDEIMRLFDLELTN